MNALAFAFASALLVVPSERHIDCSGWGGNGTIQLDVRVTAMDGTIHKTSIELFPGSDDETARDSIWLGLRNKGWRGREVGKAILVLEGSKTSHIRSVEFTSKGWKPDVRVVFVVPDKK